MWFLQTRAGKRTGFAAFRIAVDMVEEGLIDEKEALMRVEPNQLNQLLRPVFDLKQKDAAIKSGKLLAKGLNAGPGAASGRVVFNAPDAVEWRKRGEKVILARIETSPEDIKGMDASEGILTASGRNDFPRCPGCPADGKSVCGGRGIDKCQLQNPAV